MVASPAEEHFLPATDQASPSEFDLTCTVTRDSDMTCGAAGATDVAMAAPIDLGLGGHFALTQTGTSYSEPILEKTINVKNLLAQPAGTEDGTTPTVRGTEFRFFEGPT